MKYEPLGRYLKSDGGEIVALSFGQIESIIGSPLPQSARAHDAWWSNNTEGHVNAQAWVSAGYRAGGVDRRRERVTFRKTAPKPGRPPFIGSMKGTVTFVDGVDLTEPADPDWGKVYE